MTRVGPRHSAAILAIGLCGPGLLAGAASSDARGQAAARHAYVIVLDDQQAPVAGLTPSEVVILEDGAPRQVTAIVPAADPISIGILVDTAQPRMGSSAPTRDLRNALTAFLETVRTGDSASRVAVMQTAGAAVMTVDFTNEASPLTRAVGRLFPSQRTSAVVMEALVDMGKAIGKEPHRRRAIVSIDFDSQETSGVQGQDISDAVQTAGASVWAVSIRGSGSGSSAARESVLDAITEITGGLRLTGVSTRRSRPRCRWWLARSPPHTSSRTTAPPALP